MTKRTIKQLPPKQRIRPSYAPPVGDDARVQYCPSCEREVRTVPGEGVVNQALRCCCYCGSYTEDREISR